MLAYLDSFFYLVGKAVVVLTLFVLASSLLWAILIVYSFKTGRFFYARGMLISLSLLESVIKPIFLFGRIDDTIVDQVSISLQNYINRKKYLKTPFSKRFIFMPQCVRDPDCPAKLTPEGIKCVNCGRCEVGASKTFAEGLGYNFFIVPGSSFIKRIIKKYKPEAIVGVGCQMEIKEGLILCHSYDIPAIGVPLSKAGCVGTTLDWEMFYEAISNVESRNYFASHLSLDN
jgi:hypothetical protein